MQVKLISITPDAEQTMLYIARVSSPDQNSGKTGLLRYCIEHRHWSVFEHAHMTIEITTSRTIARQVLRHDYAFSEFSQRYAEAISFETYEARKQTEKNRQSSEEPVNFFARSIFWGLQKGLQFLSGAAYRIALATGISRECARFLLLETATTKLYMTGNIRSWIHYLQLRTQQDTQKEHRNIANEIKEIFILSMPILGEAVFHD